jgi:hypothetical protein
MFNSLPDHRDPGNCLYTAATILWTVTGKMNQIAKDRSEQLVEAHHRFSQLLKERTRYQVVQPVLPMDVLGV